MTNIPPGGPHLPAPEINGTSRTPLEFLNEFLRLESAGGLLLLGAAALALVLANSPLAWLYDGFLGVPVVLQVGALEVAKPLLLWINDGLMAVFFLLVGCEVKREILEGQLSKPAQVLLPGMSAVGGMLVPALIYVWLNLGDPVALDGWAIPAATDIAFALGILALLGPRVPASLKLFLLVVAIIDDLGAIIIIALFYTADLSLLSLVLAAAAIVGLVTLNLRGVMKTGPYLLLGAVLWLCVLKSGVHATLAGVALGLALPLRTAAGRSSPLREVEHSLHPWVAFLILPLFAFANAGVALQGVTLDDATGPVPAGIALGLLVGKPVGVLLPAVLLVALGLAEKPTGANWLHMLGVSLLCGVGFTMSLFIGTLAFEHNGADLMVANRIGILGGSLAAASLGYLLLRLASPAPAPDAPAAGTPTAQARP